MTGGRDWSASGGSLADQAIIRGVQRARIIDAVVEVVAERGFARASVELVIARAEISRRTFYEHFNSLDASVIAVMDRSLEQVSPLAVRAFEGRDQWQDGMRSALAAVLDFFDSERALARVNMVETLGGGATVREHRERIIGAFRGLVLERIQGEVSHPSPLAPEGALASVMGIVRARLMGRTQEPLIGLVGPLMGVIVGPFMDQARVAREIEKGNELAREVLDRRAKAQASEQSPRAATARIDIPELLMKPRAHRARQSLLYVVEQGRRGRSPSNLDVARSIGVSHTGQLASLLGKLASLGLLVKRVGGPGLPNEWSATATGEQVAHTFAGEMNGEPVHLEGRAEATLKTGLARDSF